MGQLKTHSISLNTDGTPLRVTNYDYALLPFIGRQYYSGNWLGWPTLVLAQIRPMPASRTDVYDLYTSTDTQYYSTYTEPTEFDEYGFPLVLHIQGVDVLSVDQARYQRVDFEWLHDLSGWFIGLPARRASEGYQVQRAYEPGNGLLSTLIDGGVRTDYEYDVLGNLRAEIWTRDGAPHRKTYSDYHRGRPQFEVSPVDPSAGLTQSVARSINDLGQIVWSEDAAGNRTVYETDFVGRITSVSAPATAPVSIEYGLNSSGDLAEIVMRQNNRQRIVMTDGFGRATLLKDYADINSSLAPRALSWLYDANGRIAFQSYPFSWSASVVPHGIGFSYDALGRITAEINSATELSVDYCYSWRCNTGDYSIAAGKLFNGFVRTDEEGYQAGFEYAAVGRPGTEAITRVIEQIADQATPNEPLFRQTSMQVDAHGNITSVAQGGLNDDLFVRQFIYAHPRLIEERHPESGVTLHEYDERGNRISTVVADRPAIRFRYDGLNRLTAVDYPGADDDIYYAYDSAGRLESLENPVTRWTYEYDAADRLIAESILLPDKTAEFSYQYDQLGNLQMQVYPTGRVVDYDPDGFGRPRRAGDVVQNAEYWPNNAVRSIVYGNGVSALFRQNARQMPRERKFSSTDQTLLQGFLYTYDGRGNMLRITDHFSNGYSSSMKYDGLSRLVAATDIFGSGEVSYDATDDILHSTLNGRDLQYSYDSENRLESLLASESYQIAVEHDEVGNIIATDQFDYVYNPASQLIGVAQLPDLRYGYDGNGRRTISEDSDGRSYSVYNKAGVLSYVDGCDKGGQISEFVYLGAELVGRMDTECAQGCHP
jgi:YD repeat-containing protein